MSLPKGLPIRAEQPDPDSPHGTDYDPQRGGWYPPDKPDADDE